MKLIFFSDFAGRMGSRLKGKLRIKNWSGLYALGYLLVGLGTTGFYRRFQMAGLENVPKGKPILFAPNHQNAFIDGAILGYKLGKPIYFLGRSDVFKKRFARWLLSGFNCLPIYRERDGVDAVKMNNEVFDMFADILQKKRPIVIFPEGNQEIDKRLRVPLKKGVFRIAIGAERKYGEALDVHIVPVGIDYEKHTRMGGDVFINFGPPIRILDHIGKDENEQNKIYNELVDDLALRISDLMVDISDQENYELIHTLIETFKDDICEAENANLENLHEVVQAQKAFIEKMGKRIQRDPEEAAQHREAAEGFMGDVKRAKLRSWLFEKERHSVFFHTLFLIAIFPLHVYGLINSYLPYKIPDTLVNKKVKDEKFYASIKVIAGALLFYLFWILQTVLVASLTSNCWWVFYVISLPISAWLSYSYWIKVLKLRGKLSYNKEIKKENTNTLELRNRYLKLKAFYDSVYS